MTFCDRKRCVGLNARPAQLTLASTSHLLAPCRPRGQRWRRRQWAQWLGWRSGWPGGILTGTATGSDGTLMPPAAVAVVCAAVAMRAASVLRWCGRWRSRRAYGQIGGGLSGLLTGGSGGSGRRRHRGAAEARWGGGGLRLFNLGVSGTNSTIITGGLGGNGGASTSASAAMAARACRGRHRRQRHLSPMRLCCRR